MYFVIYIFLTQLKFFLCLYKYTFNQSINKYIDYESTHLIGSN